MPRLRTKIDRMRQLPNFEIESEHGARLCRGRSVRRAFNTGGVRVESVIRRSSVHHVGSWFRRKLGSERHRGSDSDAAHALPDRPVFGVC